MSSGILQNIYLS